MAFRSITPAMSAHLDQTVTTLAACIKITPDESQLAPEEYYTEHDVNLIWQGNTYVSSDVEISTIQTSLDFKSDNCTITFGILTQEEGEELAARYLNAGIDIFLLNHQDTSETMGRVDLFFGYVDSVEVKRDKEKWIIILNIKSELAKLAAKNMERYSRTCRTAFGSTLCGVPVVITGNDKFEVFPYTAKRGDQRYSFPATATQITLGTWQEISGSWTINLPNISYAASNTVTGVIRNTFAYTPTKEMWSLNLYASATSTGFEAIIRQKDAAGNILTQHRSGPYDIGNSHSFSGVWRVGVATVEIEIHAPANVLTSFSDIRFYEFDLVEIDQTRHKLARIPKPNLNEELPILNPYFHIQGDFGNTLDVTKLAEWDGLINGNIAVFQSTLQLTDGYVEQQIKVPPVACSLIPDGCYHILYDIPHTLGTGSSLDIEIQILDASQTVVQTYTATNTQSDLFQITTVNPYYIKVKLTETTGANPAYIDSVRLFLINAYYGNTQDGTEVTLTAATDRGQNNDIWYAETLPVWYRTVVTSVTSQKDFTIDTTGLPTDTYYGSILWVSGPNAGLHTPITGWTEATGAITLPMKAPKPISVGDILTINVFCDKSINACATFNNAVNFVGEPFIPTVDDLADIVS